MASAGTRRDRSREPGTFGFNKQASGPHTTDRGSGQARGYPREVHDEPRHRIAGLGASQGAARNQGQYGLTASPDSAQTEGGTGSGKPGRHIDTTLHQSTTGLGAMPSAGALSGIRTWAVTADTHRDGTKRESRNATRGLKCCPRH